MQEKILNGFNHNVNYDLLNKLNFVPKFLGSDKKFIRW
ncbi:PTS lichenan-specific IIA component domain protein, partial [Mycoplasmopsis synoviae]